VKHAPRHSSPNVPEISDYVCTVPTGGITSCYRLDSVGFLGPGFIMRAIVEFTPGKKQRLLKWMVSANAGIFAKPKLHIGNADRGLA